MTRHQRRKAAKARQTEKTVKLAAAALAHRNAEIVKSNLSSPLRPGHSKAKISSVYRGLNAARAVGRGVSY